jgi:hypothetical protein
MDLIPVLMIREWADLRNWYATAGVGDAIAAQVIDDVA